MTLSCDYAKKQMRSRFDAGEELDGGLEEHLHDCERCRAYLARLRALEQSFAALPIETAAPDLAQRIQNRIGEELAGASRMRRSLAALTAVSVVAAAVIGWFFPFTADLNVLTGILQFRPDLIDWGSAVQSAHTELFLAWDSLSTQWGVLSGLPAAALWAGLAVSIVALAVFNGVEAASMRRHPNGSPHSYRRA